ncbi:MAG TPA: UvrD-helicase domain-containing protein [Candidatus Dormibacteraeota bacterium]
MPAPEVLERLLNSMNPQQREAAEHSAGPLLIFAGAGSGKTRVLTTRIALLIARKKVWPDRLLAVTFTNKAAREMRGRVAMLVGEAAEKMWVGTFHHTAVRMLRRDAEKIGMTRSFVIFDDDDTRAAIRRVLDELGLDQKKFPPGWLANRISQAKTELQTPDTVPVGHYRDEIVRRAYGRYQDLLRRSNGLDFDDLIVSVVRLLQADEEALASWRDRFRYVLVDEYQDTNRSQYVLVKLLTEEHRNLAVVGDDDQSIYAFRGADVRNILDFKKDFPEATVVHLEQNYRSTQAILDTAFHVIRHNPERAPKRLWTDRVGGEKVTALQAYNETEEAEFVADEIDRLRRREERRYGDFAVLYRTNAQSRAFEDVFSRRRIPYTLVGGTRFWERREVKDLLAYLRFLFNPLDTVSFSRIAGVPKRSLGPVAVDRLIAYAGEIGGTVLDAMTEADHVPTLQRSAAALQRFHQQLESLRATMGVLQPAQLAEHVIELLGLDAYYSDGTPQGEARLENLGELIGFASDFARPDDPNGALEAFLTEAALVSDVDSYSDDGEAVTLITLHMVKGLEFPVVFFVGLDEGLLPHERSLEDGSGEALAEERRLAYVGITRARDRLYLTCAFKRHMFGQSRAYTTSRFLRDIPSGLLAQSTKGAAPAAFVRGDTRERRMEREVAPSAPVRPLVQRFREGERVQHPSFGSGTVMKSTMTRSDEEIVVRFDRAGVKILSGSLAPLSKP